MDDAFPKSVRQLREELEKLRSELRQKDAAADRRGALQVLTRMISAQREFMQRWPHRAEAAGGAPPSPIGDPKRSKP